MIWSDLDMDMGWKWLELGALTKREGLVGQRIFDICWIPPGPLESFQFLEFLENHTIPYATKNIKHRPPPRFASYILIIWYNMCHGQVLCEFLWLMDVYLWLFMDITGSLLKSSHLESIHVGSWTIHQGRPWHFYQLKKQIEPWWNSMIDNNLQVSKYVSGWWFQTWILFSIIYGMSSFPLTNIVQDG